MKKEEIKKKKIEKRHFIQLIAAVLYNCNITGFIKGSIYKGSVKGLCVPGLNCYSCPGAIASCPLGSLQSGLTSYRFRFPYYVLGTLILFGLLLGRVTAGTLEAGIPLTAADETLRSAAGFLFSWKVYIAVVILILCVFCYRAFCRFLCPLGAVYSLFNPISFFVIRVDQDKCIHCNACVKACRMDVKKVCDRECIHCGKCRNVCPVDAIHYGVRKIHTKEQAGEES